MSRSNKDVGGYRGRRTITDVLKFIAVSLAVLVVLAAAGLFYLQRYLVYTDDGVKLELPPFLQALRGGNSSRNPSSSSLPNLGDISLVEEPAGSQSDPDPQPPEQSAGFALALPVSDVISGSAAAMLEEAGASALILEVKGQDGNLAWPSGQAVAARAKVNGSQAAADALRLWNEGETYTIARVCCFRDDSVPYFQNSMAMRQGNINWRDELGLRWMNPTQEGAQAYIAGLCGELAELGFDEIVLEHFAFPTRGKLDRITKGRPEDAGQRTQALETLLSQVRKAVEPYGAKVSLRVERDTLTGAETLSGVTVQLLEQYADRIWLEEDGLLPAPADLLSQAGLTGGPDRLVSIAPSRTEDSPITQAILSGQS